MVNLSDACLVWCAGLFPPVTPTLAADFVIFDAGDGPQIAAWNAARLGPQPSARQLAGITPAQVQGYYAGQAVAGAAALVQQIQSLTCAVRLGDVTVGQMLNHVLQYLAGLVAAVNADRQARGLAALPAYAPPADITQVTPSPFTVATGKGYAGQILTEQPGWVTE